MRKTLLFTAVVLLLAAAPKVARADLKEDAENALGDALIYSSYTSNFNYLEDDYDDLKTLYDDLKDEFDNLPFNKQSLIANDFFNAREDFIDAATDYEDVSPDQSTLLEAMQLAWNEQFDDYLGELYGSVVNFFNDSPWQIAVSEADGNNHALVIANADMHAACVAMRNLIDSVL